MAEPLKLMCVLAHPDDESLGSGGTLAKYAAEGIETSLVTATRGERGWTGPAADYPGPKALGQVRERELRAAAAVLGLREVAFLDYLDGELDEANPAEAVTRIVGHLRRVRPQVVATFGPDGGYGHPDHIAICQLTTAAVVRAADPTFAPEVGAPHQVAKLYYGVATVELLALYHAFFGEIVMDVDGVPRRGTGWPEWDVSARIETGDHWRTVWEAVSCHRSQLPGYEALARRLEEEHRRLWGLQCFYRAFSLVNGGRGVEHDLFAGLR